MKDFSYYLSNIGEIGYVNESFHSLVYVNGLPNVHPKELVIFETGDTGQVLSLSRDVVQVLLLSTSEVRVGIKVARTNQYSQIPVSTDLLGKTIDSLGNILSKTGPLKKITYQNIDKTPPLIKERKGIEKQFETGVSLIDIVLPLGKGQRELIIGDRKTGKTQFLFQTILTQAKKGTICVYAVIGQRHVDCFKLTEFLEEKKIREKTVIVASTSSDPAGLIFLTPYAAMTVSEYFRDLGMDVLLILDDLTTHARTYREISLLGRRFPGRGSYPGDIFYMHAKLIERAGNFTKGSITCLPVAESILGDLSGYIQTNLMSMTDGHIFFDIELYNQGKRPAINPFLSVTRVGHQTQEPLTRDMAGTVSSFLVLYERMKQFMHFGAEVGETARGILAQGGILDIIFNQGTEDTVPLEIGVIIIGFLWAGKFNEIDQKEIKQKLLEMIHLYGSSREYKKKVDISITSSTEFLKFVSDLKRNEDIFKSNK